MEIIGDDTVNGADADDANLADKPTSNKMQSLLKEKTQLFIPIALFFQDLLDTGLYFGFWLMGRTQVKHMTFYDDDSDDIMSDPAPQYSKMRLSSHGTAARNLDTQSTHG